MTYADTFQDIRHVSNVTALNKHELDKQSLGQSQE
jgi:hypothetical protein